MAKKQQQARRKQKFQPGFAWVKPLLAVLTVVGSVIGLTLMLEWMNDPRQWPVKSVNIEGSFRHLQQAQLREVVSPLAANGFFVMNVSDIQAQLQQLPWVEQVSVRRVWPDRLDIRVREQQPVAHWGESGFMNARAEVFEPRQSLELPALPQLDGPDGHQQRVLEMFRQLSAMLQPLQLGITQLRLDARRTWGMRLSNGLKLEVGRNRPEQRVARFVRVYPAILAAANGRLTSVDLRYSNGFAVHWQASSETAKSAGEPA